MPTTDFSRVSDEVLEDVFNRLFDNPNLIPNAEERRAWVAERNRRAADGTRKPDNVTENLEAAASPIEVDPTPQAAKPRAPADEYRDRLVAAGYDAAEADAMVRQEAGMDYAYRVPESDESLRASAAQHRARTASHNAFDASLAAAYGHNAPAPAGNPETVMVDGVSVPTHPLSDGQSFGGMYTLRALREAKDAAEEQRWLANHRAMIDEENAKYGHYSIRDTADIGDGPGMLTQAQYDARMARKRAEDAARNSPRAQELRAQRLAARAGVPEQITEDMSPEQRLRAMGRNRESADLAARKQAVIRRAQASQNPLEYLGRQDVNDWQKMVMAERFLREPQQMTPLGVDAAHNAQLTALGLRVAAGQGFQQPTEEARQMAQMKIDEAERAMPPEERSMKYRDQPTVHPSEVAMVDAHVSERYSTPGSIWSLGGLSSSFTTAERQQTIDWLVNEKGYDPVKAERIVDSVADKRSSQSWLGNWE